MSLIQISFISDLLSILSKLIFHGKLSVVAKKARRYVAAKNKRFHHGPR